MRAVAWNRHGGRSNSDIMLLPMSGEDINILDLIFEDCIKASVDGTYCHGSTRDKAVEFCKQAIRMTHPCDPNPLHFVEVK